MTMRDPRAGFSDVDAPTGRHGMRASAGVLAEFGGEAADVAGRSASIALARGEAWRASRDYAAALVAVEEGFVLVCNDTGFD